MQVSVGMVVYLSAFLNSMLGLIHFIMVKLHYIHDVFSQIHNEL